MFVIGKIFEANAQKILSVRAHVTKTMREICARANIKREREKEREEAADLLFVGRGESSPNEWSNIYSGRCHLAPFTLLSSFGQSRIAVRVALLLPSNRINRDFHGLD